MLSQQTQSNPQVRVPKSSNVLETASFDGLTPDQARVRNIKIGANIASEGFELLGNLAQYDSANIDLDEAYRQANVNLDLARQAERTKIYSNAIYNGLSVSDGAVVQQVRDLDRVYQEEKTRSDILYHDKRRALATGEQALVGSTIASVVYMLAVLL